MIAIPGMGGTLAAAVTTQRGADRARTCELEHTRQLQREEREYAARQAQVEQRRTCYAALSAGTRVLANVLAKVLHDLEKGRLTEELRSDLDRACRDHRLRHAEAQVILPDGVAHKLWGPLWAMRRVMRVDLGITAPEQDQRQREADRCPV
ncbi:hypothetical protein [Streptomyces sp. NRRL F-5755]|uniref:hypothetical protein n=1 Tax=Streptomyces sp. NRRL F-5755 TaxID=1519475 RepID=UPI001F1DD456|nr:hypothetical protein [Streptomyces sp. NRRL F-5755]